MLSIHARKVLLAEGWADEVRLRVADGRIASIDAGTPAAAGDCRAGIVIPGLANAHSHAFQRALVGRTEECSPASRDTFWTWRNRMYALTGRIDARSLAAIARQAYVEMLESGYTGVAEFHYLHRERPGGQPGDAMLRTLMTAAGDSGIRLTYVPVLYQRAGFDQPQPTAEQARFCMTPDEFEEHFLSARKLATGSFSVGIGAHSLRAVTAEGLRRVVALSEAGGVPMHLHIAEQQREVEQCLAALGARPVRWLADHFDLDGHWCLVHATHLDDGEVATLARSGAVACLCPSTEGNLGDGLFPLQPYLQGGGRVAIGSDSQVTIDPFEELRWLEYGQRLASQSRNVAAVGEPHTGKSLFERVLAGGAQASGIVASGQPAAGLASGSPADLVVLDDANPMLLGHDARTLLDALVFSGFPLPIDRVMVHGEWRVVAGRHVDAERTRGEYARVIHELYPQAKPA